MAHIEQHFDKHGFDLWVARFLMNTAIKNKTMNATIMRIDVIACALAILSTATAVGQERSVSPKLVICGGGTLPDSVFESFRSLAGPSPRLVVIPTASNREINVAETQELWQKRGFEHVAVLHANDRSLSSAAEFVAPLKSATAVWFGGGDQQRIADAYLDTPVEKELHDLLKRGGVIGGTSAGAAIQSRMMIAGGNIEPHLSTGFDLLPKAIIDQHFLQRNRLSRLMAAVQRHPELAGVGIDEGTALVVQNNKAMVHGNSYVLCIQVLKGKLKLDSYGSGDMVPLGALGGMISK